MFKFCLTALVLLSVNVINAEITSINPELPTNEAIKQTGNIEIEIPNLPKDSQGIIISIYRSSNTFLKKADKVFYFSKDMLFSGNIFLKDITFGEFAIGVVSDQNGNKVLDTKIFGIPAEPVGFANNPKPRMGPPKYSESLIKFNTSPQKFIVKLLNT